MGSVPKGALWLGFIILLADIISKAWVVHSIPPVTYDSLWYPYGGIGVFKNFMGIEFSIVHMTNKGAAWGSFADFQKPLLYLRIGIILALIVYLFYRNKGSFRAYVLVMIIAGATGNVLDYFIYGHVIDMLHFVLWGYDFAAFNVADSAICLGVFGFILASYCGHLCVSKKSKKATSR